MRDGVTIGRVLVSTPAGECCSCPGPARGASSWELEESEARDDAAAGRVSAAPCCCREPSSKVGKDVVLGLATPAAKACMARVRSAAACPVVGLGPHELLRERDVQHATGGMDRVWLAKFP